MKHDLHIFKAFSDETRLRILFLLAERELCVCEIVAVLDAPQGRISRHLAQLKHSGLVTDRRDGTWIYYGLAPPAHDLARRLVAYLKKDAGPLEVVQQDRQRLDDLADQGRICVPNPAYVPVTSKN